VAIAVPVAAGRVERRHRLYEHQQFLFLGVEMLAGQRLDRRSQLFVGHCIQGQFSSHKPL
jgi:hypothetical protein